VLSLTAWSSAPELGSIGLKNVGQGAVGFDDQVSGRSARKPIFRPAAPVPREEVVTPVAGKPWDTQPIPGPDVARIRT
jgi:hypothetical protein